MGDGHDELGRDGVTEKILKRVHGPPRKCSNQHKMEKKPGLDPERNKRNKRQTKEETKKKEKKETQTKGHAMSKGARDKNDRCAACFCVSGGGHYHTASPPVPCANWP